MVTLRGRGVSAAIVAAVVTTWSVLQAQDARDGFAPLFAGTLQGWVVENSTAENFFVRDGLLRVEGSGGWIRSEREFGDVSLRLRFRFVTTDADSGLFLRAAMTSGFGPGWPNRSYQVQIRNPLGESRFPPVGGLFRHGMPAGDLVFDAALVQKLAKGTGEWQELEVDAIGDRVTARFNGVEVMRAGQIANPRGFIGLQGETGAVEFQSIEVRER